MKSKYVLSYSSTTASEPILWKLVKDYNILINILRASINPGQEGTMLVELSAAEDGKLEKALEWLGSIGVSCLNVSKKLSWKEDDCIHCGACSGVCFSGAIQLDRETWKIQVDWDKCVACGNCVKACPMGCYLLDFGE